MFMFFSATRMCFPFSFFRAFSVCSSLLVVTIYFFLPFQPHLSSSCSSAMYVSLPFLSILSTDTCFSPFLLTVSLLHFPVTAFVFGSFSANRSVFLPQLLLFVGLKIDIVSVPIRCKEASTVDVNGDDKALIRDGRQWRCDCVL